MSFNQSNFNRQHNGSDNQLNTPNTSHQLNTPNTPNTPNQQYNYPQPQLNNQQPSTVQQLPSLHTQQPSFPSFPLQQQQPDPNRPQYPAQQPYPPSQFPASQFIRPLGSQTTSTLPPPPPFISNFQQAPYNYSAPPSQVSQQLPSYFTLRQYTQTPPTNEPSNSSFPPQAAHPPTFQPSYSFPHERPRLPQDMAPPPPSFPSQPPPRPLETRTNSYLYGASGAPTYHPTPPLPNLARQPLQPPPAAIAGLKFSQSPGPSAPVASTSSSSTSLPPQISTQLPQMRPEAPRETQRSTPKVRSLNTAADKSNRRISSIKNSRNSSITQSENDGGSNSDDYGGSSSTRRKDSTETLEETKEGLIQQELLSIMANLEIPEEKSTEEVFEHCCQIFQIDYKRIVQEDISAFFPTDPLQSLLLNVYISRSTSWIDVFLPYPLFTTVFPRIALLDETGMILSSMFCLSSLILHRNEPTKYDSSIPISYYHDTISKVRKGLSQGGSNIPRCLISTIFLCIYELVFGATDTTHVKGAATIFRSVIRSNPELKLADSPFYSSCFWAIFVCDMIVSLKWGNASICSLETFWTPLIYPYLKDFEYSQTNSLEDTKPDIWWLYKATLNYSSLNEFVNLPYVVSKEEYDDNRMFKKWLKLKTSLDEYDQRLPQSLRKLSHVRDTGIDGTSTFPLIFFNDELAALAAINYYLAKIFLYNGLISRTNTGSDEVMSELEAFKPSYRRYYARSIVGVLKTYHKNTTVWSVTVHALRQAVRYLADDYHQELETLLNEILHTTQTRINKKIL